MTDFKSKRAVARDKLEKPNQAWWDWYLAPSIDYREVYGDAFVWTEQEKQLMVLQKIKEQQA